MLELAAGAGIDGPVLCRNNAGGYRLRQRERTADRLHPISDRSCIRIPQFYGRQGSAGVDLDHRQIGRLVGADHPRWPAEVLGVGIGRELHVDLVCFLHHVEIGDDVALRIDNEPRAKRLLNAAAPIAAIRPGNLAPEEAVEEVLEVILTLSLLRLIVIVVAVVARVLLVGLGAEMKVARSFVGALLGQRLRVDVHHRRSHLPGNPDKIVGRNGGANHLERSGICAVVLLLLPPHAMGCEGTGHDSDRKGGKHGKC